MRINKKLNEWLQHDLISSQQLQSILDYEQQTKTNFILPGFVWLGISIIALGIIAIIAANWVLIPNSVKLIVDFILLILLGTLCYYWRIRDLLFDGILLLFLLFCLASIGLISQVFQLGGEFYQALIFWAVITFPAVLQAKKSFIARLWAWLTVFAVIYALIDNTKHFYEIGFIFICVDLVCLGLGLIPLTIKSLQFVKQAILEIGCIGTFFGAFFLENLLVNSQDFVFSHSYFYQTSGNVLALISYFLLGIVALMLLLSSRPHWQKILLLPPVFLSLVELSCWWFGVSLPMALGLFIILIDLLLLTIFFALQQQKGLYRLGLIAIALRMLWLYWFLLGSLITTAGVMVITGIIIILLARQVTKIKTPFLRCIGYTAEDDHE